VSLDADSALGIEDRLKKSPALRATLKKLIEMAEFGENNPLDI
jgi:hypothetical protein